ncbi:MAG: LacI family DNA-binding transcriptional regulator [Trueperaceae bacterium]
MKQIRAGSTTLNDVAEDAGVSYQTVSRVINGHPHVAAVTRQRVLDSVRKLDYRPNLMARGLVTRRSHTIGIVTFGSTYYGPAQMVANIDRAIQERGYRFAPTTIPEMSFESLAGAVQELRERGVEGIVMITPILDINLDQVRNLCAGTPFVMIDIAVGAQLPSVVIEQQRGGRLATEHLLQLGHRRLAEISGPLNWCDAKLRHDGWIDAHRAAGLSPGTSVESDWSPRGGYLAARRLLDGGTTFSGLVVGNDQMALGAVRALREQGVRIPEDVSVIGFDNIPESAFFEPPLTTVVQDFEALGRQSAEYLIALIEYPNTPVHQRVLYPELVVRGSTGRLTER